ncbi:MAG: DUF6481 family protein [Alphaproteobacteria bacterium]|jgi:hypothetical protein
MQVKGTSFNDRAEASLKAKQELLARARANSPANDPEFAQRQAERLAAAREKSIRDAERKQAKREASERFKAEREAERIRLEAEAKERAEREAAEKLRLEVSQQIAEAKAKLASAGFRASR